MKKRKNLLRPVFRAALVQVEVVLGARKEAHHVVAKSFLYRVTFFLGLANFAVKTVQLFGSMQVASSPSLTLAHYHNPYLLQRTGNHKTFLFLFLRIN